MTAAALARPSEGATITVPAAAIWLEDRVSGFPCTAHDLSADGCRLYTSDAGAAARAPDRFELSLGDGLFIELCEVVARGADEIEVRFLPRGTDLWGPAT